MTHHRSILAGPRRIGTAVVTRARRSSTVALFGLLVGAAALGAQAPAGTPHPNFAGTWRLDAAKSVTPPGLDSLRMTITQRGDSLSAVNEAVTAQGSAKNSQTLTLDGKATTNSVATAGGQVELTSVVAWRGPTMLVTSTAEIQGTPLTQRNEWTLDAAGKVLTIKGTVDIAGQHVESTLVLVRQ